MEGLFIVIAIIIGISNIVQKQNRARGRSNMNGRRDQYKQKPVNMQKRVMKPQPHTLMDLGKSLREMVRSTEDGEGIEDSEGIEAEDRSRTGSLGFSEQDLNYGNIGYSSAKPKPAGKAERTVSGDTAIIEEKKIFDLTEGNLVESVIMSEILGPPRAFKRRIR